MNFAIKLFRTFNASRVYSGAKRTNGLKNAIAISFMKGENNNRQNQRF